MKLLVTFAMCAVTLVTGCTALSRGIPQPPGPKPVSICDRAHFQDFLDRFSEDVQVQRTHTAFPLHKREYRNVATQIDPIPVELTLKESEVRFPVYPSPGQIIERSLTVDVSAENGKTTQVRLSREDTDYLVVYSFEFGRCWKLTRVEDRSH
jgi:hypothetical protein